MWSASRNLLALLRRRPLRSCLVVAVLAVAVHVAWRQATAWRHYFESCRAAELGDFASSWRALQPCLAAWPQSASTQLLAARTARRAGNLQDAQAHLERARQLDGRAEDIVLERYLLLAMSGELTEVEPKLLAFLDKEHSDSPLILETLSRQYMNDYRLLEARALLQRWLVLRPNNREAYIRLGWIEERLGNNAMAIMNYQMALSSPSASGDRAEEALRLRLIELLLDRSQPHDAEPHLLVLRERLPDNPAVALAEIRHRHLVGKPQEAAALLDKLMQGRPPEARLLLERARLHMSAGEPDRAEPFLRDAVKLSPHDRQVVYLLAQCLKNQKNKEASLYESRLTEIRADEKKMRELMQELAQSPKDAWLHVQIGQVFLRNGFARDGERSLLTAIRYDPKLNLAHLELAAHYEKSGAPEMAAMHRRAAAKETP